MKLRAVIPIILLCFSGCTTLERSSFEALLYVDEQLAGRFNQKYQTTRYTPLAPVVFDIRDVGILGGIHSWHFGGGMEHGAIELERNGDVICVGRFRTGWDKWYNVPLESGDIIRLHGPGEHLDL